MNKIDFLKYQQFPVSSETLQFMQAMFLLSAKVASIGGQSYILDGCEDSGGNVSVGTVVVNGEIMPFEGGAKLSTVVVAEAKTSVQVYDTTYADLYADRKLIFGSGAGQMDWSTFKRLPSLLDIDTNLSNHISDHKVDWSKISNIPSAFPPSSHGHKWSDLEEKPTSYPPSSHNHTSSEISGLPKGILLTGNVCIGDIKKGNYGGDSTYQKTISLGSTVEKYMVLGCLRTEKITDPGTNTWDDAFWQIVNRTNVSFDLVVRTIDSDETQNLYFDYAIVAL